MRAALIKDHGESIAVKYTAEEFPEERAMAHANARHDLLIERVSAQTTLIVSDGTRLDAGRKHPNLCLTVFVETIPPPSIRPVAVRDTLYTDTVQLSFECEGITALDRAVGILRQTAEGSHWVTELWMKSLKDEVLMAAMLLSADFPEFRLVVRDSRTAFVPQKLTKEKKLELVYRWMYANGSEMVSNLYPFRHVTVESKFDFGKIEAIANAEDMENFLDGVSRLEIKGHFYLQDTVSQTLLKTIDNDRNALWDPVSPYALALDRASIVSGQNIKFIDLDRAIMKRIAKTREEDIRLPETPITKDQVEVSTFSNLSLVLRVEAMLKLAEILSGRPRIDGAVVEDFNEYHAISSSRIDRKQPIRVPLPLSAAPPLLFSRKPLPLMRMEKEGTIFKTLIAPSMPLKLTLPPPIPFQGNLLIFPVCWMGRYSGSEEDARVSTLSSEQDSKSPRLCDTVFAMGERLMCVLAESETDRKVIAEMWWRARIEYAARPDFYTLTTAADVAAIDRHFSLALSGNSDLHELQNEENSKKFADIPFDDDATLTSLPVDAWIARCVAKRVSTGVYERYFKTNLALFEFEGRDPVPVSVSFDRLLVPRERIPHVSVDGADSVAMLLIDYYVARDWDRRYDDVFTAVRTLPFLGELDWHFPTGEGVKAEIQDEHTLWLTLPTGSQAREYARGVEERLRTRCDFIRIGKTAVAILVFQRQIAVRIAFEKEDEAAKSTTENEKEKKADEGKKKK